MIKHVTVEWELWDEVTRVYDYKWKPEGKHLYRVRIRLGTGVVIGGAVYTQRPKQLVELVSRSRGAPVSQQILSILQKGYYHGA